MISKSMKKRIEHQTGSRLYTQEQYNALRQKIEQAALALVEGEPIEDPFIALSPFVQKMINALRVRSIRDESRGIRNAEAGNFEPPIEGAALITRLLVPPAR